MIYLFGGHRQPPEGNPIYGYVPERNAWSSITPKVHDGVKIPVNSTTRLVGVTDSSLSIIYLFNNGTMFIYNALNNFWDIGELEAPYILIRNSAVMLNTGEIAYIGGSNGTANVPMNQILLYNTKSSSWYIKTAKAIGSDIPSPRQSHTASIAPDGRIFIYGGFDGNETAVDSTGSTPTFAVLEYHDGKFEWFSPHLFNQSYVMRIFHTSHVFENYLVIILGRNLTHNRLNTIDLIDISNRDSYTVVTDFVPENYVPPPPKTLPSIEIPKATIIMTSVFSAAGFMIILGGIFFLIKCLQNPKSIPTPGGDEERHVIPSANTRDKYTTNDIAA